MQRENGGSLSHEGPTLETLDHTIRIGSTPTFLYFDLYLYSVYTQHSAFISSWLFLFVYMDKQASPVDGISPLQSGEILVSGMKIFPCKHSLAGLPPAVEKRMLKSG